MSFRKKFLVNVMFSWRFWLHYATEIRVENYQPSQNSHLVHAFNSVNRKSLASILLKQFLERSLSRTASQKQFRRKSSTTLSSFIVFVDMMSFSVQLINFHTFCLRCFIEDDTNCKNLFKKKNGYHEIYWVGEIAWNGKILFNSRQC